MNDHKLAILILALGISPTALAQESGAYTDDSGAVRIILQQLKLHPRTKKIIDQLTAMGALSVTDSTQGLELRIDSSKIPENYVEKFNKFQNLSVDPQTREFVVSDSLTAALIKSGTLSNQVADPILKNRMLEELQLKVGTSLDGALKDHSAMSFS